MNYIYTCEATCNQEKPCGNIHCSANPKYAPPKKKAEKKRYVKPLERV